MQVVGPGFVATSLQCGKMAIDSMMEMTRPWCKAMTARSMSIINSKMGKNKTCLFTGHGFLIQTRTQEWRKGQFSVSKKYINHAIFYKWGFILSRRFLLLQITLISAAHSLGGGGEKIAIDPWRLFRQHHPGLEQEDGQLVSSINIHNVLTLAPRYYLASPASAPGEQHVYQVFSVCSFFSSRLFSSFLFFLIPLLTSQMRSSASSSASSTSCLSCLQENCLWATASLNPR